jgi:putative tryptophan/tyrosine transport system substrate-binding protein
MRRREFITLLGGAAAWPLAARAQQGGRMRRIGVLMSYAADDPAGHARLLAFAQELAQSGWIDGRNVRIDVDPQAWLADVLARINDHNIQKLDQLLPWNWKTTAAKLAASQSALRPTAAPRSSPYGYASGRLCMGGRFCDSKFCAAAPRV